MKIHQLLKDLRDPALVADTLSKEWQQGLFDKIEVSQIASFLLNCGFFPTLLSNGVQSIDRGRPVPWPQLAMAIYQDTSQTEKEKKILLSHLIEAAKEKKQLFTLCQVKAMDSLLPELAKIRNQEEQNQNQKYLKKRQSFKDELDVARSQQILEQEKHVLEKWQRFFPKDPEILEEKKHYKERWARRVLGQKNHSANWRQIESNSRKKTKSDNKIAQALFHNLVGRIKEDDEANSSLILDFAIMLKQMEHPQMALNLLKKISVKEDSPIAASYNWLLLELYLECHREVDALAHLVQIEKQYAEIPDTVFAVNYARAKAMQRIGQTEKAISILRSIIKIRPHYRNAQALMFKISGNRT